MVGAVRAGQRPVADLDPHMVGIDRLVPLLLHGASTPELADIAVVEGVMGLYDGASGREGFASTAHVAGIIGAPSSRVVASSQWARSIGALGRG